MRKLGFTTLLLSFLCLSLTSCKHEENNFIYMPDMVYSPAFKAQKGQMRPPVPGTVDRDHEVYHYLSVEEAGKNLKNPLPRTMEVLKRGEFVFNTYCYECHGPAGEGNGPVTNGTPIKPPTLISDKIRDYPDGSIFHVMTRGQTIMPSYASQILVKDRWAVVHYVRALQRAKRPTAEDLKAYQLLENGG
jgi:Cytochrome C oxidase, cbb3-type, subunit III